MQPELVIELIPNYSLHRTRKNSVLPVCQTSKQPPRIRVFQKEELKRFLSEDSVSYFTNLNETFFPAGFQF